MHVFEAYQIVRGNDDLLERDAASRFFATLTLYIACGRKKLSG